MPSVKTEILQVQFDALSMSEALAAADALLRAGEGGTIVTVNPEIVLKARRDSALLAAINGAELVLADGIGDLYAARILGKRLPERVSGADLVPALLQRLAARGGSVFLYGAAPGVAERAGKRLRETYPGLRLAGCADGYLTQESALWRALDKARPALLLVGLGAPRQELWMARSRARTGAVMIGVGGLLDLLAGDTVRAPAAWQRAGLEWLYRAIRQPRRLPRIAKLPGFLLLAARERLRLRLPVTGRARRDV